MIRSMSYVPANSPKLIYNSMIINSDAVIFDLEDSVPENEKTEAEDLLKNALNDLIFKSKIFIRINDINSEWFESNLRTLASEKIYGIKIPKTENREQLLSVIKEITDFREKKGVFGKLYFLPTLESLNAFSNISDISCVRDVSGLSYGIEDIKKEFGKNIPDEIKNFLRIKLVLEAKRNKIDVYDSVFSDLSDTEKFKNDCIKSFEMGFTGRSVIHPGQIDTVNKIYITDKAEYTKSKRITELYISYGGKVFSFEGEMIDKPVYEKYLKIFNSWRDFYEQNN